MPPPRMLPTAGAPETARIPITLAELPVMDEKMPTHRRTSDLTTGPISRTLLIFALPVLGANVLQSLNGSINAVWIGRFLGESALAATSNANLVLFMILGTLFGIGMAATILVAQSAGLPGPDLHLRRNFGSGSQRAESAALPCRA
ncbi:MATE family efflux transporter [Mesorhizobium sp. A623]